MTISLTGQHRTCDLFVEEFDKRAHKEGSDDRSDTCDRRYVSHLVSGKNEQNDSENYTAQVGDYPDVFELTFFPCTGDNKGYRIIRRNS